MSSRALRKAQREREPPAVHEIHELESGDDKEEEEEEEQTHSTSAFVQKSAFALLGEVHDSDTEDVVGEEIRSSLKENVNEDDHDFSNTEETTLQSRKKTLAKGRKKKKSGKKGATRNQTSAESKIDNAANPQFDEIDAALEALSFTRPEASAGTSAKNADKDILDVCKLLSIDIQELQVGHEMKRLFGRAAFHDDEDAAVPRARVRIGESASLSEAVSGKYSQGGPGLSSMLRRRNIFVHGSESWPRATGGGLGMEVVDRRPGGIVEYRFSHNAAYQYSQHEFQACVQAMDPGLMVNLLRANPYHISTLLQVSEIAKQERDHSTSGELLERALFSFGKSLHSTFAANLALGKARLDFGRFENREFWLAAWRYIINIGMRATWRTAYEWARLLLSLDPDNDPYRMCLIVDRLALRAHAADSFLALSRSSFFSKKWADLPNIHYSQALAYKITKDNSKAAECLAEAVERYPWVASRLFQDLEVQGTPPSVWGIMAGTAIDILYTEVYVQLAKDLWKLPDSIAFLTEHTPNTLTKGQAVVNNEPIGLDEGRHIILVDSPPLIGLLPNSITSKMDSVSDPLPPPDSIDSYSKQTLIHRQFGPNQFAFVEPQTAPDALIEHNPGEFISELHELQTFFEQLIPGFSRPPHDATDGAAGQIDITDDAIDRVIAQSRISIPEMRRRLARLVTLREALVRQPGQRVAAEDGHQIEMTETGQARRISSSSEPLRRERESRIPGAFDASDTG